MSAEWDMTPPQALTGAKKHAVAGTTVEMTPPRNVRGGMDCKQHDSTQNVLCTLFEPF